jgi:hypothetical protein
VATVAYALGVNPPVVKYVIVRSRVDIDEALQKLGRANRQSQPHDTATFSSGYQLRGRSREIGSKSRRVPHPGELILSDIRGSSSTLSSRKRPAFPKTSSDTDTSRPGTPSKKRRNGPYISFDTTSLLTVYNPPEDSCY